MAENQFEEEKLKIQRSHEESLKQVNYCTIVVFCHHKYILHVQVRPKRFGFESQPYLKFYLPLLQSRKYFVWGPSDLIYLVRYITECAS